MPYLIELIINFFVLHLFRHTTVGSPGTQEAAIEFVLETGSVAGDSAAGVYDHQRWQSRLHMRCIGRCLDVEQGFRAGALRRTPDHPSEKVICLVCRAP